MFNIGWIKRFINRYKVLITFLLVFFVLRIPSLFEPHRYADQGVRKGLVLYRDIHDNKPPFLYLVAALAGDLVWFRLILLAVHAVGVVIFWKLAELIFNKNQLAVIVSTFIFGVFSTLPPLEGNIANGENFMIVSAWAGVLILYSSVVKSKQFNKAWFYFVSGILFSI